MVTKVNHNKCWYLLLVLLYCRVSKRGLDDRARWNTDNRRSSYVSTFDPDDLAKSAGFDGKEHYLVYRQVASPRDIEDDSGVMEMWRSLFPGLESWKQQAMEVT